MEKRPARRSRLTIRTLLGVTLIAAFGFGWLVSARRVSFWQARYFRAEQRSFLAERQLQLREVAEKPQPGTRSKGFLYETNLEGSDFSNIKINAGDSAFQKTWLVNANLQNATIIAGGSSFQKARFDQANLRGARLAGGGGSFQMASFSGADLRNADLAGGSASFQGASLRAADLTGATIKCPANSASFQVLDINAAKFQDADISALTAKDLASCYFSAPPTYNEKTRFPSGFDPVTAGWRSEQ